MLVENKDITVVIQGPLYIDDNKGANIFDCIDSIKNVLPNAKIIISTWEEEKNNHGKIEFLVDKIIYQKMPEAIKSQNISNNILRQVVSTINGLKEVNTKYALKMRANFTLYDKTSIFEDFNKINMLEMVHNPIYTYNLFSLPDYIQFGKIDKLIQFWDFDIKEEDYFCKDRYLGLFDNYSYPYNFKFSPEQYLGINWVKKQYDIDVLIQHRYDVNYVDFLLFKNVLKNDFYFVSYKKSGIKFHSAYYFNNYFIENTNEWLNKSTRKQFLYLLYRKYFLAFFNKNFYLSIFKVILFKFGLFELIKKLK